MVVVGKEEKENVWSEYASGGSDTDTESETSEGDVIEGDDETDSENKIPEVPGTPGVPNKDSEDKDSEDEDGQIIDEDEDEDEDEDQAGGFEYNAPNYNEGEKSEDDDSQYGGSYEESSDGDDDMGGGFQNDLSTILGSIFIDPVTSKNIAQILTDISKTLDKLSKKK
jgi:hypothetical protein